ncbi:hypothetical protein DFH08DRAFT_968956 [Mycena albidolilacea]|uniref:Uncharacterized protein n=1 Tax=Mycena albidolilacea TaxID=1033008 RepID=A0AAD7EIF0_9AGAR|nr:hypothetical protein DFH08DRAFT_968956 [Mycena albidolilacea]
MHRTPSAATWQVATTSLQDKMSSSSSIFLHKQRHFRVPKANACAEDVSPRASSAFSFLSAGARTPGELHPGSSGSGNGFGCSPSVGRDAPAYPRSAASLDVRACVGDAEWITASVVADAVRTRQPRSSPVLRAAPTDSAIDQRVVLHAVSMPHHLILLFQPLSTNVSPSSPQLLPAHISVFPPPPIALVSLRSSAQIRPTVRMPPEPPRLLLGCNSGVRTCIV